MTEPRGIRNNNPGNIRWSKDPWMGLLPVEQRTDASFCQFTKPEYGVRAMCKVLLNYRSKPGIPGMGEQGIDTVQEIIHRWAPPSENDTGAYVKSVADAALVRPDEHCDLTDPVVMSALLRGIIKHENGVQPYSTQTLNLGMHMAGLAT